MTKYSHIIIVSIFALTLSGCFGPDKFTDEQMFSEDGIELWNDLSKWQRIKALRGTLESSNGAQQQGLTDEHLEVMEKCMDELIENDEDGGVTIGSALAGCSLQKAMQGIGAGIVKSLGGGR